MDWRSILKFDENLYNHTDESTKEKHQKILDFLKDRPKTKRTGLRIKQFLDSGELDESFTPFDLPRNSITEKTKEYYKEFGDFGDSKNKVNDLVNTYSNVFRVYRDEIEREMGGMPLRDFTLAFSKLVKNLILIWLGFLKKQEINLWMNIRLRGIYTPVFVVCQPIKMP